jgi:hypothetical protein
MIRTRLINNGKQTSRVFYDTNTGATITSLRSVTIHGVDDTIVTVVWKEGVPYIHLPHKDAVLVSLHDAIEVYNLVIEKVA